MSFQVRLTPEARSQLMAVEDRRVRPTPAGAVDSLCESPELKGKPLLGELQGYRSLRAAGQRYRILYRVDREIVTVVVVAAGRRKAHDRKDIYELARKLIRLGLAKPPRKYRPGIATTKRHRDTQKKRA